MRKGNCRYRCRRYPIYCGVRHSFRVKWIRRLILPEHKCIMFSCRFCAICYPFWAIWLSPVSRQNRRSPASGDLPQLFLFCRPRRYRSSFRHRRFMCCYSGFHAGEGHGPPPHGSCIFKREGRAIHAQVEISIKRRHHCAPNSSE